MAEERNCLDELTFEEANENEDMGAFGFGISESLCAHCVHWNNCRYSDYHVENIYETGIVTKCNFYEEE